jgi:hypothetical protein
MDARRLIPIGAVVTALLVIAGIASHGRPLRPGLGSGPTASFFDYVATTALLVAILMLAIFLWALNSQRSVKSPKRRSKWNLVSFFLMLAASAVIAALLANSKFEKRFKQAAQNAQHSGVPQAQPSVPGAKNSKHFRNARIRWDEVAVVLLIVGGIGVYLFLTRDERREPRTLLRRRAAVSRALDDSIDDLRRDPNIRRAIIAAYKRMEDALAVAGLPRAPAEAPYEYLERSLVELDAGAEAARHLTGLFERAKFSHHEPAESMRDEAVDALVAVRDDLRAAPA